MGGPSNKETLKLLEISDDSKSLSDLDLPEISSQRKRKVRRKTRPKPSSHRSQDVSNSNQCNRLIVWVAIFLTCCWLLTLSYMIAVIHSENLRLEKQIKKRSSRKMESASQVNVPLRSGGKKMRKRRELDALVAHSLAKRANKKNNAGNGVNSQDQLLSPSTDEQEDFGWPKVIRSSNRNRNRKFSFIRMCAPLIFVTCISLSLGFMYWLYFDLRQQLYEYRQKIEEVAVTSQNLPEALQKWHETSKNLEQNQTIIYGKISELQHSLENLSADFSHYKQQLNEKKDYSKDEKLVADFGAKIAAVSVDVEGMKDKLREFQKDQTEFKNELQDVKSNFSKVLISAAAVNNNNQTTNCSEEISQLQKVTLEQIKSLSSNMSLINDTLSQKVQILVKDIAGHKQSLDDLSEINANTTSHVSSIEKDWMEVKEKFKECEKYKIETNSEIAKVRNATQYLGSSVEDIGSKCGKYHVELINFMNQFKSNPITEAPVNNEGPAMYIQSDKQATSNSDHKTTQRMDLTPLNSSEPLHMSN